MKVYLILGLLVTATYGEKKINLEDIERDNLRTEGKTKAEKIQAEETKYSINPDQQQYQISNQYNNLDDHAESYIPPQQIQNIKYGMLPEYIQPNQYAVHEVQYQQPGQILPQQNVPSIQYYNGYQQQAEIPTKGVASSAFESQKLNYQPEVVVGNQIQSVQQKAVTEKYTKTVEKGPVYLDIPTTQLLTYYPHLDINSAANAKGAELAQPSLHQLTNTGQQISLPVYIPVYNQKQLASSVKTPHQYSTIVPVTFSKVSKGSDYTFPITSKKYNLTPLPTVPLYVQPQQTAVQEKKLLYTQAYIAPSQSQYVQQFVYTQPGIIYSDPTPAYSDIYARIPAYVQDNSLRGQANQYQIQQLYVTPTIGNEVQKEILPEPVDQDVHSQNYIKVEQPKNHFVPPQLPAQNFKSGITQLEPVNFGDEESLLANGRPSPSEPRSLLDTYIPSKIIAAQDSARYKEKPIKLEGGFLPSKINFNFKKFKSE